jgi:transcriptional regulator with XRE-family HTH domain
LAEQGTERRALAIARFMQAHTGATAAAPLRNVHSQLEPLRGLKRAREDRGLTIADLAMMTNLTTTVLALLESRDHPPSPRTWQTLADALGVEREVLMESPPPVGPVVIWLRERGKPLNREKASPSFHCSQVPQDLSVIGHAIVNATDDALAIDQHTASTGHFEAGKGLSVVVTSSNDAIVR